MPEFCNVVDYPMNIICKFGWIFAVVLIVGLLLWYFLYPKKVIH